MPRLVGSVSTLLQYTHFMAVGGCERPDLASRREHHMHDHSQFVRQNPLVSCHGICTCVCRIPNFRSAVQVAEQPSTCSLDGAKNPDGQRHNLMVSMVHITVWFSQSLFHGHTTAIFS